MGSRSQHISIGIDRPITVVYDVAADPLNLPKWAAGLDRTHALFRDHDGLRDSA